MSKSTQVERDGYAIEVSLVKFKPAVLVLFAACLITLVSVLSWLGPGRAGQLAASKAVRNDSANQNFHESPSIGNNATSQPAPSARAEDAPAADKPAKDEAVERDSVPAASEPAATAGTHGVSPGYAVQAGSYNTISEANERVSNLRAAGFEARVAAVELEKRGTWYRVYSGRFETREEAKEHDRKLHASGVVGDTFITAPQQN